MATMGKNAIRSVPDVPPAACAYAGLINTDDPPVATDLSSPRELGSPANPSSKRKCDDLGVKLIILPCRRRRPPGCDRCGTGPRKQAALFPRCPAAARGSRSGNSKDCAGY